MNATNRTIETGGSGKLITLREAAATLPVPTSHTTLFRWANEGVRIGEQIIKLATVSVGIRIFTTAKWLSEFQLQIDAARAASDGEPRPTE
jgi:hypothetical protein